MYKRQLLAGGNGTIIGAWTTASKVVGDTIAQQSRLSMPLVNEVVIGLKDKDAFNASEPKNDGTSQFVDYITHPTLPALIELLFPIAKAPTVFPRTDLLAAFATGITGLNENGSVAEMQRLNTAIAPTPRDLQNNLGVIAGITGGVLDPAKADLAGFPNGRRPGDDVVDIALRVVMGKLLKPSEAPVGDAPLTDGAQVNATMFANAFPYLTTPLAGSPNDLSITIRPQAATSLQAPFKGVPGTYDPATGRLTIKVTDANTSFLGVNADGKVSLSAPAAANGQLSATVK